MGDTQGESVERGGAQLQIAQKSLRSSFSLSYLLSQFPSTLPHITVNFLQQMNARGAHSPLATGQAASTNVRVLNNGAKAGHKRDAGNARGGRECMTCIAISNPSFTLLPSLYIIMVIAC